MCECILTPASSLDVRLLAAVKLHLFLQCGDTADPLSIKIHARPLIDLSRYRIMIITCHGVVVLPSYSDPTVDAQKCMAPLQFSRVLKKYLACFHSINFGHCQNCDMTISLTGSSILCTTKEKQKKKKSDLIYSNHCQFLCYIHM